MKKRIAVMVYCCLLSTSLLVGCGTIPSTNDSINTNDESSLDESTSELNNEANEIVVGSVAYDGEEGTVTVTDLYHGETEYGIGYVVEYEFKNSSDKELDCWFGDSYLNDRRIGTQHPHGFDVAPGKIGDTYCVIFDSDITDKMENFEIIETNIQFAYPDSDEEFSSYPVIIKKSSFTEKTNKTSSGTNDKTNTKTTKTEKNGYDSSTNQSIQINGVSFEIPDYFGSKSDKSTDVLHYYYAETGEQISMLMISVDDKDSSGVTFESYAEQYMDGVTSSLESYEKIDEEYTKVNGYECYTSHFSSVASKKNINNVIYLLRDSDKRKVIAVFYGETDNTDYTYFNDIQKVINSIDIKENQNAEVGDNETTEKSKTESLSGYDSLDLTTKNAYKAGINYLSFSGFSKQGLIDQLSSEYGDAYTLEQAQNAVAAIEADGKVDWKEEAVEAAKNYLNFTSFSKSGLIEQLTSQYGDQFTQEEAEYAANQVGLE